MDGRLHAHFSDAKYILQMEQKPLCMEYQLVKKATLK